MADEPRWEDLFGDDLVGQTQSSDEGARAPRSENTDIPLTRRAARQVERSSRSERRNTTAGHEEDRPKKRRVWVGLLIALFVLFGVAGGATWYAWANFEPQIRKILGWELPPPDFEGEGTGEALVVIKAGDGGSQVTQTLVDQGVVKSYDAFYSLLLKQDPQVQFYPGVYTLKLEMSSEAALEALQDPANRVEHRALIREGLSIDQTLEILSASMDIPLADFEAEVQDPQSFGVPDEAPSLEGYLFPATYTFDPGMDARSILQTLVNRTFQALDSAGVSEEDRHRVLTIASLIQREAGSNAEDFYKVSRVIHNRLDENWLLQFDSTSHYGYAWKHGERLDGGVFSNRAELQDDNPYNTYVHTGLPLGPISTAGDLAIDAAINPVDGPWFYFVTVNLETGETKFTETISQHNAAVNELRQWCRTTQSPNCD